MSRSENPKAVLIVAGEASGDIHGANLVRELKKKLPHLEFFGIGGDRMEEEGVDIVHHVREMSFLGFFEVLEHLPFVRRVLWEMVTLLEQRKPNLVLLIDYPGFNLRFAKEAKRHGLPVLYYISPQIWAWGRGRIKKIARRVDRMVVIFPFEEELYRKEGMDVRFVGHPLKDVVRVDRSKKTFFAELGLDTKKPTVGMLPGSRNQEVQRLLPEMRKAYDLLQERIDGLQAILGMAPTLSDEAYKPFFNAEDAICAVRNRTYEVMAHSDVVMVASGTATLEAALLGTPMVILYKMSRFSFIIGKALVRVRNFGLVNIVAEREVVPELLQGEVNKKRIAQEVLRLFADPERREKVERDLKDVSRRLGKKGASERAAEAVLEFMEQFDLSG